MKINFHPQKLSTKLIAFLSLTFVLITPSYASNTVEKNKMFVSAFFEDIIREREDRVLFSYFSKRFIERSKTDINSTRINQTHTTRYRVRNVAPEYVDIESIGDICIRAGNCLDGFGSVYRIALEAENGKLGILPFEQGGSGYHSWVEFWQAHFIGMYDDVVSLKNTSAKTLSPERKAFVEKTLTEISKLSWDSPQLEHSSLFEVISKKFKNDFKVDPLKHQIDKVGLKEFEIIGAKGDLVEIKYVKDPNDCGGARDCLTTTVWIKTIQEDGHWKIEPYAIKGPNNELIQYFWAYMTGNWVI